MKGSKGQFDNVEFVSIGQGRAVHAAFVYRHFEGGDYLGARCDKTGFANLTYGRKVRVVASPKIHPVSVTCKSCLKNMSADEKDA